MTGKRFSGFLLIYALSAILYGVQVMISLEGNSVGIHHMLFLLAYGPAAYLINALFLRRERSVNLTFAVNGILFLLVLTALILVFGIGSGKQLFITVVCYLLVAYFAVRLNLQPPRENHLILALDSSVVLTLILLVITAVMERDWLQSAPLMAGCVCSVVGLMHLRMEELRLWAIPAALLALLLGVFALLVKAAKPLGSLLLRAGGEFMAALKYVGTKIEEFLLYLTSFMKEETYEALEADTFGIPSEAADAAQSFQDGMGIIIGCILLAALAALLILFLRVIGKSGIGGKKLKSVDRAQIRHSSLLAAIRHIIFRVKMTVLIVRRRKTPWGLYYTLLFLTRHSRLRKRERETPCDFLMRLSMCLSTCGEALVDAVPLVDRALFGKLGIQDEIPMAGKILREISVLVLFPRKK